MQSEMGQGFIRPVDVKRILAVSDYKLRKMEGRGILKAVLVDGAKRYRKEDIEQLLRGNDAKQGKNL